MTSAAREQSGTSRREFYLTVQGQRLWTSLQGEGQGHALLLLMGFGGNLELWRPFRRALGTVFVKRKGSYTHLMTAYPR